MNVPERRCGLLHTAISCRACVRIDVLTQENERMWSEVTALLAQTAAERLVAKERLEALEEEHRFTVSLGARDHKDLCSVCRLDDARAQP